MILSVGPALGMAAVLLNILAATLFVLGCVCAVPQQDQKPGPVDPLAVPRGNPRCWESSSVMLLEMRSPRIADTVPAFWDLMVVLRSSDNSKHTALFWDLARVFWDLYLDCVVTRSHGLGRRHITAVHSLITDKSFKLNRSGANSRSSLSVRVRRKGHIKTLRTKLKSSRHYK